MTMESTLDSYPRFPKTTVDGHQLSLNGSQAPGPLMTPKVGFLFWGTHWVNYGLE
jgi:hypothetical protein